MKVIEPGGTIGFLGGGQLARMMALEARRMGYRIAVLDPDAHGPAAAVADRHVKGKLDDLEQAAQQAADRLEADYSDERLRSLIHAGGVEEPS